jgi:hypothetical protein
MLYCHRYEFMVEPGRSAETERGSSVIRKIDSKSYGVTFARNDPSGGKLAYILSGNLDEFIPDWLELVEEEDEDANGQELHRFAVDGPELILGEELACSDDEDYDYDDEDYDNEDYDNEGDDQAEGNAFEPAGSAGDYYLANGFKPAYLVLDAKASRIVVDSEGYPLSEDGSRISPNPIVTLTQEQTDEIDCSGWDYDDVYEEIVKAYRAEYPQE